MAGGLQYQDRFWWSGDGVRLHARDYSGDDTQAPLICIPGLTRNARDFGPLIDAIGGSRRIICVNLRGRGESGYAKDPMSYVPFTYWQDVEALIAELGLARFALCGTSLGGIVSMLLAAHGAERVEAAILNDVGPVIEPGGLERVRGVVRRGGAWPTWMHAARALSEANAAVYPAYDTIAWLAMAKRLYKIGVNGRVVQDFDPRIAEPFRLQGEEVPGDLWSTFAFLKPVPTLIVRGALTDILSEATVAAMLAGLGSGRAVTVPDVGHAPVLDEPEALGAIRALLAA